MQALCLVLAAIVGLVAGFFGGVTDWLLSRLLDVLWAFPVYLLAISLSIVLISHGRIVADGTGSQIKALAAGRTVRATLPGADAAALSALPGVESVDIRGEAVYVHAKDTDEVARHLLNETTAHDLEITARGLEDAFISLTGDDVGATTTSQGVSA